ncbi:hypothetical protein [Streptomyces sp. NPDC012510]|uniref:hypothetical protein n=1 Tax=Streptomyces sp. NPDC012510 TaxID=3364838 RepID=UPI0036ED5ECB
MKAVVAEQARERRQRRPRPRADGVIDAADGHDGKRAERPTPAKATTAADE